MGIASTEALQFNSGSSLERWMAMCLVHYSTRPREAPSLDAVHNLAVCLRHQLHATIAVTLKSECADASVAQPVELRGFAYGIGRELKKLSIAKIAEFGGTPWIVTLRNHGQSGCTSSWAT